MHKEILTKEQIELLPLVKQFRKEFYLVGGTAIALQIGHRRSIDFDLFKFSSIRPKRILTKIGSADIPFSVTRRVQEQLNVTINQVKFTFYEYPFDIEANIELEDILRMPSLIDLSAMKAYALGRRSKWKDYVDFYFLLKDHFTLNEISAQAEKIYGQLFSPKLFRAQLCYFNDIDYIESVEFLVPVPSGKEIKDFLTEKALDLGFH
jgi:hypothetical protein